MAPAVLAEGPAVLAADWFPGEASAVGQAREFVADVLGKGWPGLDDVLLLVSEISSNAVRHTASGDDGGWFDVVGAENLCHLAGCTADRRPLAARPARLPGRGMIFGLRA
jgi:hypothetical protein